MCEDAAKVQRLKLAKKLKTFRDHLRLSQARLADGMGVSIKAVQSWEQGVRYPSRKNRVRLSHFLELEEDKLFPKKEG